MTLFLFLLLTGVNSTLERLREIPRKTSQRLEKNQNDVLKNLTELPAIERCYKLVGEQKGTRYYHMKQSMNYIHILQECESFLWPAESSHLIQANKKFNEYLKITGYHNIFDNNGSIKIFRNMENPNELTWEDPNNLMHRSLKEPFKNCLRLVEDQRPNCIYDEVSRWNPTNIEAYQFFIKILFNVLEKVDGKRDVLGHFLTTRAKERKKGCRRLILKIALRFAETENEALDDVAKIIAILRRKHELNEIFLGPFGEDTALTYAAYRNQIAIVKTLLKADAKVDAQDGVGCTALIRAAEARNLDIVKLLLDEKADVEIQDDRGYTALITAVGFDAVNLEIVKVLLEKKAKVDIQSMRGRTALIEAAWKGNLEIMEVLLKAKAKINISDQYGRQALMRAACAGYAENVKFLLDHGAKAEIDIPDKLGETALMHASQWGSIEIVNVLLKAGAKKEITRSRDGKTAAQIAEFMGNADIAAVINSF